MKPKPLSVLQQRLLVRIRANLFTIGHPKTIRRLVQLGLITQDARGDLSITAAGRERL